MWQIKRDMATVVAWRGIKGSEERSGAGWQKEMEKRKDEGVVWCGVGVKA
jgi:hypothetical protein